MFWGALNDKTLEDYGSISSSPIHGTYFPVAVGNNQSIKVLIYVHEPNAHMLNLSDVVY